MGVGVGEGWQAFRLGPCENRPIVGVVGTIPPYLVRVRVRVRVQARVLVRAREAGEGAGGARVRARARVGGVVVAFCALLSRDLADLADLVPPDLSARRERR